MFYDMVPTLMGAREYRNLITKMPIKMLTLGSDKHAEVLMVKWN